MAVAAVGHGDAGKAGAEVEEGEEGGGGEEDVWHVVKCAATAGLSPDADDTDVGAGPAAAVPRVAAANASCRISIEGTRSGN